MTFADQNTLWRERDTCVKNSSILKAILRFFALLGRPSHPHLKHLNDRQLRDIGLAAKDVEALRHKLPSQHTHHPRG